MSEEIEVEFTKKWSQEFSRTENRISGALSNLTSFFWTHQFRITPHSLRIRPRIHMEKYRERMGTAPRMIVLLMWGSVWDNLHKITAQRMPTTWWQEFKKKFPTAPLYNLQASRRNNTLQVQCNSAMKTPLRRSEQTNFCWPFNCWRKTAILQFSTTTFIELPNCQCHSPQLCPSLTGNPGDLSCLKKLFPNKPQDSQPANWKRLIKYFHFFTKGDSLQTFKNTSSLTQENLGKILAVFCKNHVKLQTMATQKHKLQKVVNYRLHQNLVDFPGKLHRLAKDAFWTAAHAIIEQLIYSQANMPPHQRKSIKHPDFWNGTSEQYFTQIERVPSSRRIQWFSCKTSKCLRVSTSVLGLFSGYLWNVGDLWGKCFLWERVPGGMSVFSRTSSKGGLNLLNCIVYPSISLSDIGYLETTWDIFGDKDQGCY